MIINQDDGEFFSKWMKINQNRKHVTWTDCDHCNRSIKQNLKHIMCFLKWNKIIKNLSGHTVGGRLFDPSS